MTNKRLVAIIVVAMSALALGPVAAHARYLNPDIGRFQTLDSYEGAQNDPLSLHKYLYGGDDPVNNVDPSGHMSLSDNLTAMTVIGVLAANTAISLVADHTIAESIRDGTPPDGVFLNLSAGASLDAVYMGVDTMVYYDLHTSQFYLIATGEIGISPLGRFKKEKFRLQLTGVIGFAFNAPTPDALAGVGVTATWPLVTGVEVIRRPWAKYYYLARQLRQINEGKNPGFIGSKGNVMSRSTSVVQYGYSPGSKAAYVAIGGSQASLMTSIGWTFEPVPLTESMDDVAWAFEFLKQGLK
jgi:RHS repeat-associated protein